MLCKAAVIVQEVGHLIQAVSNSSLKDLEGIIKACMKVGHDSLKGPKMT